MTSTEIKRTGSMRRIAATRETAEKIRQVGADYKEAVTRVEQRKVSREKLQEELDFLQQLKKEQEDELEQNLMNKLAEITTWEKEEFRKAQDFIQSAKSVQDDQTQRVTRPR